MGNTERNDVNVEKLKKNHKKRKVKDIQKDEETIEQSTNLSPVGEEFSPARKSKKKHSKINADNSTFLKSLNDNDINCHKTKKILKEKESGTVCNGIVKDAPDSEIINNATTEVSGLSLTVSETEPIKPSLLRPDYIFKNSTNLNIERNVPKKQSDKFNVSNLWQKDNSRSNNEHLKNKNNISEDHNGKNRHDNFGKDNNSYRNDQKFAYKNEHQNFSRTKDHMPKSFKRDNIGFSDEIKCKPNPRQYTVSIAVPASILQETCPLDKFRTYVVGQISRAASIYCVDEIIVYNDNCLKNTDSADEFQHYLEFMKTILEYQECPQYIKRQLFPMHSYLKDAGILSVLNTPHHLLATEWCIYREGIVLEKCNGKTSCVNIGLQSEVDIDRKLEPNIRVTVKLPPEAKTLRRLYGTVVSPDEPRTKGGLYWGYTVRIANSLSEVMKSDRFKDGYDLIIGTSDKGTLIGEEQFETFSHALIVFGGVDGLEVAMKSDPDIREKKPKKYFQKYINTCPDQGSKTIRTEEAILISLSHLSRRLKKHGNKEAK